MQHWCALLEQEISTWPHVTSRPMFGMLACYRDGNIFAALPRSRAAETPFSLLVKLPRDHGRHRDRPTSASTPGAVPAARTLRVGVPGSGWTTFTMESAADIREALRWLERAYSRTKNEKRRTKNEERQRSTETKEPKAKTANSEGVTKSR